MLVYVILTLFYLICIIIESSLKMKNKAIQSSFWIVFLIVPLFILSAFRNYSVGNDTIVYYKSFFYISEENFFAPSVSYFETGYILLVRLFGKLGFDYFGFQLLTTFFIYYVFSLVIKRYSSDYSLSVYIFLTMNMFFDTMNISRSYLALAILLISVKYIIERKPFKFAICVILSTFFHTTAIVFLIMYPLVKIQWSYRRLIHIMLFAAVVGILFDQIVHFFVNFTGKYLDYLTGSHFIFDNNIAIYIGFLIDLSFLLLGLAIQVPKNEIEINSKIYLNKNEFSKGGIQGKNSYRQINISNVWLTAIVLSFVVSVGGLNSTIMSRVGMYFSALYIVFIPNILVKIKNLKVRIFVKSVIIVFLLLHFFIVMIYRPNWYGVIPYEWFW